MKISKYFTLQEFTTSETAMKQGIIEQYSPSDEVIENLKLLAKEVADKIRVQFGSFTPTNGYRCKRLNTLVGGSKNSQHLHGKAFDETFIKEGKNISNEIFFWLLANKETVKWTKIIWEKGDENNPRWLHIEHDREKFKKDIIVYDGTSYVDYFQTKMYQKHKQEGLIK